MIRSVGVFLGLAVVTASFAGCTMAKEQMAYRDRQRRDCTFAGGYFEENKPGAADNYTCKGLPGNQTVSTAPAPTAPPTNCRTETTTVKRSDGTEETKTNQVCSSF